MYSPDELAEAGKGARQTAESSFLIARQRKAGYLSIPMPSLVFQARTTGRRGMSLQAALP
jgi:hypothetical protein